MTNKLQDIFAETTARSGDWVSFSSRSTGAFIWQVDDQGPFQALHDAVSSVRQYLLDRRLDAGVKAAREGIESVMAYLAQGGTFTTARDAEGLDAGYYIARTCLPYDFTALGVVEMSGAVQHVSKVRYYHQDPRGVEVFKAACAAGLRFTKARDIEGHDAAFFIAQTGHAEVQSLFVAAGGALAPNVLRQKQA